MRWVTPLRGTRDPPGEGEWCRPPRSHCGFLSTAADHVSHLENVSEEEINRLLGMVVDVENLFMSVHKEEDTDTKQVYFYLFKVRLGLGTSHGRAYGGACAGSLSIAGELGLLSRCLSSACSAGSCSLWL